MGFFLLCAFAGLLLIPCLIPCFIRLIANVVVGMQMVRMPVNPNLAAARERIGYPGDHGPKEARSEKTRRRPTSYFAQARAKLRASAGNKDLKLWNKPSSAQTRVRKITGLECNCYIAI